MMIDRQFLLKLRFYIYISRQANYKWDNYSGHNSRWDNSRPTILDDTIQDGIILCETIPNMTIWDEVILE